MVWETLIEDDKDMWPKRKPTMAIDQRGPWYSTKMVEDAWSKGKPKTKSCRKMHLPIECSWNHQDYLVRNY